MSSRYDRYDRENERYAERRSESEYYLRSRGYKDNGNGVYTNDNPFSDTVWIDKDGRISHSM